MHSVAVVRDEEVRVAIVVVVEEGDGVCLACRFPYPIAHAVNGGRVVALELFAGYGVLMDYRGAVGVCHPYLRTFNTCIVGDLRECEVTVVQVKEVVVTGVVVVGECAEIIVLYVANIEIEPAVAVDIGAGYACGGARVDCVAEC